MPLKAQIQTADLSANNSFVPQPGSANFTMGVDDIAGISVTGTFTGTVSLERSFDDGATWGVLDSTDRPKEWTVTPGTGCILRTGFDGANGGGYASGTAHIIMKSGQ
jgi:hypothetical protein